MDASKIRNNPNPRDSAGFFSILFHCWITPLFRKGYSTVLTPDDLYDPLKKDRSKLLGEQLEVHWNNEIEQTATGKKNPSFLRALAKTFWADYICLSMALLICSAFSLSECLFLGQLLFSLKNEDLAKRENALWCACGLVLSLFFEVLLRNRFDIEAYRCALRVRVACCSLIYKKSLRLSCAALGETATGQVVNLLANDVSRFDSASVMINYMWLAPLLTATIIYLLWQIAGIPTLIGMAVFFIIVSVQSYVGKLSSVFRRLVAFRADERIRLVGEIISGVQVIKMYAWEKPFIALVELARKCELSEVRKLCYVRGVYMTFRLCSTRLALFATLVAMSLLDIPITADKVYMFASMYDIVSFALSGMFVRGVAELSECKVSVERLQKYLLYDECKRSISEKNFEKDLEKLENEMAPLVEKNVKIIESPGEEPYSENVPIQLENAVAKWNEQRDKNTLDKVNVKINKGNLFAVIGPIGSGKTSLLQAILGELAVNSGSVKVSGKVSYACQDPWIFASTVRQNITFGSPFERRRYDEVVRVCALMKDFEQFPQGDLTVVGERGASLSGGQKARITLARAVYRRADIYLLDDPLSAVDSHVSRHLFEKCICGFLRRKTRILVTHQVHHLAGVDKILLMKEGAVVMEGNFRDLANSGIDFAELLREGAERTAAEEDVDESINPALKGDEQSYSETAAVDERRGSRTSYTSSMQSLNPSEKEVDDETEVKHPLVDNIEASSKGKVRGSIYLNYFLRAGNRFLALFLVPFFFAITQISASGADYWISFWTNLEETKRRPNSALAETQRKDAIPDSLYTNSSFMQNIPRSQGSSFHDFFDKHISLYIYGGITVVLLVSAVLRSYIYYTVSLRISKNLHRSMFNSVIRTAMRFFDTNPSGRVLNRFAKDMGSVDEILPKVILDASQILFSMFGAITLTVIVDPILLLPVFLLGIVFMFVRRVYLKTSKNIKRLEGMVRSPVFSHLNVTLQGMSTIRAFGAQRILEEEFDKHQDLHSSAWYIFVCTGSAFGLVLDILSCLFLSAATFKVFIKQGTPVSQVGLTITQALIICFNLMFGVRQSAEVANNMMSAERVLEYCQLPPEKEPSPENIQKNDEKWPARGELELKNVYLRYSPEESPVLIDLNIRIKQAEKVGIVGRTGAGKSSLISTVLRLTEPEGCVLLDGVNTANVPLAKLRSSVSIIPQDPVLFSGTMRYNLDPFNEYNDQQIWRALEEVELKYVLSNQLGLETRVLERGSNFSVGQRQLVCLARAILRSNRLLMLDEATANVDPQTDALIQRTIREKFEACTVLTVAHRLNTIMDSDRVLVMDSGTVVEFDHPHELLKRPNGYFYQMVEHTGATTAEQLRRIAQKDYEMKSGS